MAHDLVPCPPREKPDGVPHVTVEAVDTDAPQRPRRHLGELGRQLVHPLLGEEEAHARLGLARDRDLEKTVALELDRLLERQPHAARDDLEGNEGGAGMLPALRRLLDGRQHHGADLLGDAEVRRGAREAGQLVPQEAHGKGPKVLALGHDRIDHVDRDRLVGAEGLALQDDRERRLAAHRVSGVHQAAPARKPLRAAQAGKDVEQDLGKPERGALGRHDRATGERQLVDAAEADAVRRGDPGKRALLDAEEQCMAAIDERREIGRAPLHQLTDVRPGAEAVAIAEEDRPGERLALMVRPQLRLDRVELLDRRPRQGVHAP